MSLIQRRHLGNSVRAHVDTASEENRLCFSQLRVFSSLQIAGLWLLALLFGVHVLELIPKSQCLQEEGVDFRLY